jgi:hypothetical protein
MTETLSQASSATTVPPNEYERLLVAMPESLRERCRKQLSGSGLAANHPLFKVLADFYEETASEQLAAHEAASREADRKGPARDFLQEATLHASQSKQLLEDFRNLPGAILSQIEKQLVGLLSSLTGPVERLEIAASSLDRNVEALPVLLLRRRSLPCPPFKNSWERFKWWLREFPRQARWALSDHMAWIVCGTICVAIAITATVTIVAARETYLARIYETAYQDRLSHLEADSAQNTVALNRLLAAGITLKFERSDDNTSHFLILQGAKKAAQPVVSPEGLAVQVWP